MEIQERLAGGTPRQIELIKTLLEERNYVLLDELVINSSSQASKLIRSLLQSPKKLNATREDKELFGALSSVPKSRYAIPASELFLDILDEKVNGDLLFVEVKEHHDNLQIRRLHGSVGGFSRSKMSRDTSLTVLGLITQNPYKYARLFGEHYSCCGKCGAELTDEVSRSVFLGPHCRKVFKAYGF
jgi:hypothetical protein